MELKERLAIQAKNLTALIYRVLGIHPETGAIIHQPVDSWPDEWIPMEVSESYIFSGGIEIAATDLDGGFVALGPGNWVDLQMANQLWETVVAFVVESSRGGELWVKDPTNTMVYTPKCRLMVATGLPDASVMKAITNNNGSQAFTKCPVGALSAAECRYPYCLSAMVVTPQPSIKAAKMAYRDSVCVALTRYTQGNKMLFLTNGANHLNLVNLEQAIEVAWNSRWLLNLRSIIEHYGFEEPETLEAKLQSLLEAEEVRRKETEQTFETAKLGTLVAEEVDYLPANIAVKEKKPKEKKSRKKKAVADLSELNPEVEIVIEAETAEDDKE